MAKNTPPPPEPHYGLQRWMDDWNWVFDSHGVSQDAGTPVIPEEEFSAYFVERYGTHAGYFRCRLAAALDYKRLHIDPLPEGEERTLASGQPLLAALYRLYSQSPDDMLAEPYPVSFVVSLAREHKPRH